MFFGASWSLKLKLLTATFLFLTGFVIVDTIIQADSLEANSLVTRIAIAVGLVAVCAAFAVRGYSIEDGQLRIHRLGRTTRFDLRQFEQVDVMPGAMTDSIRTHGIGGVFGFVGHYRSSALGPYKAFVTNGLNTVVLRSSDETIVVSPDRPDEFAEAVRAQIGIPEVTP